MRQSFPLKFYLKINTYLKSVFVLLAPYVQILVLYRHQIRVNIGKYEIVTKLIYTQRKPVLSFKYELNNRKTAYTRMRWKKKKIQIILLPLNCDEKQKRSFTLGFKTMKNLQYNLSKKINFIWRSRTYLNSKQAWTDLRMSPVTLE